MIKYYKEMTLFSEICNRSNRSSRSIEPLKLEGLFGSDGTMRTEPSAPVRSSAEDEVVRIEVGFFFTGSLLLIERLHFLMCS